MAVAESKEYRGCETCGGFFELDPSINRTSRLYCDDACRVKAYRDRKLKRNACTNEAKRFRRLLPRWSPMLRKSKNGFRPKGK